MDGFIAGSGECSVLGDVAKTKTKTICHCTALSCFAIMQFERILQSQGFGTRKERCAAKPAGRDTCCP